MKQPTNNKDGSGIMEDKVGIDTEGTDKVGTSVL